jgi:hypothetical protein
MFTDWQYPVDPLVVQPSYTSDEMSDAPLPYLYVVVALLRY